MRNFGVFMGFNPREMATRDGTVCYNGWGMRMWPHINWNEKYSGNITRMPYWNEELIPVPWSEKRTDFDSVWVQANCNKGTDDNPGGQSRRVELVEKLSADGRVARLGACMKNAAFDDGLPQHHHQHHRDGDNTTSDGDNATAGNDLAWHPDRGKQDASMSRFKFMLAFENNLCDHYMTEKVWKAYGLGIVPVIMAGSGAVESLPSDDSYINVADFQTARQLREYLNTVANDEALYMRFFEWKSRPIYELSPAFQNLWRTQVEDHSQGAGGMCCVARGVFRALHDFKTGQLPPPIPVSSVFLKFLHV
eukprot:COSAG05_NODE_2916_length_2512_cov_3.769996_1_plen_307_part_00